MKHIAVTLIVIACALLIGCGVSMNPIYDSETLVDPAALLGVWENDDYVVRIEKRGKNNLFSVHVIDLTASNDDAAAPAPLQAGVLVGGLVKLGDVTYLDMTADINAIKKLSPQLSNIVLTHILPNHSIAKVRLADGVAALDLMHPGKLRELMEKEPYIVPFEEFFTPGADESKMVMLTGSPEELCGFLQLSRGKPLWFSDDENAKTFEFKRSDAEAFEKYQQQME